ncbi:MAG: hypothetical protein PHP50_08600 [Lachnospiraceae bacterium]|nr:hypothetical protein [Lachnospiraceae bacterium]
MRIRKPENNKLQKVVCNQCGRELLVEDGILKEGCFHGDQKFGYFSEKDGEEQEFDLCEICYDKMITGFQIPVTKKEITEMMF